MSSYVFEQLLNGICQGSIYALFAIGFALIVGVVGLPTFTHGEIIMIGAYAAYYCSGLLTGNLLVNLVMSFVISGIVGILVCVICYNHFLDAPHHISLICTLALGTLIKTLVQNLLGSETKVYHSQSLPVGGIEIGGIQIGYVQLTVIGVVILLCIALTVVLRGTEMGRALRAVSQDKTAASLMGIDIRRTILLGNVLGCGIGGVGGALYALYYTTFSPTIGLSACMKAFSSAVFGGMTDIASSALGGTLLGILENIGIIWIPSSMRDLICFLFLILVLIFLPQGLQSRRK